MDLYYDLGLNRLVRSPNDRSEVTTLTFSLDQSDDIRMRFLRNATAVALEEPTVGKFGLKEKGDYDGDFVIAQLPTEENPAGWVKVEDEGDIYYLFTPEFSTDELYELIGRDGVPGNDKPSISLMGDIKWTTAGKVGRTKVFTATVTNIVIRDDEGQAPDPNPSWGEPIDYLKKADNLAGLASPVAARRNLGVAVEFLPTVTGLTGGGADNLDGLLTVDGAWDGLLLFLRLDGAVKGWVLDAGTDAEDAPAGIVRPDDFAPGTNEKVWKLVF